MTRYENGAFVQVGDLLRMMQHEDGTYTPDAKRAFSDYLRANQTPAERLFARVLYHLGINAEPQVLLRGYIVDFFDRSAGVVFEVDGSSHDTRSEADAHRDEVFIGAGYRIVRVTNEGVVNLIRNVAAMRDTA